MLLYSKKLLLYGIKVQKVLLYFLNKILLYRKRKLLYDIKGVTVWHKGVTL